VLHDFRNRLLELEEARRQAERRQAQSRPQQEPPLVATGERKVLILRHGDAGDTAKLCEALAERFATRLFAVDSDRLVLLDAGVLVPVSVGLLRAIISAFATPELVLRAGRYEVELGPIAELPHQVVVDVLHSLTLKVAKAKAMTPRELSAQTLSEVVFRIRSGEARSSIGKAYSLSLDELRAIEQAAPARW
jgi:hypothetical protein